MGLENHEIPFSSCSPTSTDPVEGEQVVPWSLHAAVGYLPESGGVRPKTKSALLPPVPCSAEELPARCCSSSYVFKALSAIWLPVGMIYGVRKAH